MPLAVLARELAPAVWVSWLRVLILGDRGPRGRQAAMGLPLDALLPAACGPIWAGVATGCWVASVSFLQGLPTSAVRLVLLAGAATFPMPYAAIADIDPSAIPTLMLPTAVAVARV